MLAEIMLLLTAIDQELDSPVVAEAIVAAEQLAEPQLSGAAAAVAACESGHRNSDGTAVAGTHDWLAQNPVSSASGAFQFVDGTFEWVTGLPAPASAYPPAVQLAAFYKLWDDGAGASHWYPSRSCWKGRL